MKHRNAAGAAALTSFGAGRRRAWKARLATVAAAWVAIGCADARAVVTLPAAQWTGYFNIGASDLGGCCNVIAVPVTGPGVYANQNTASGGSTASATGTLTETPFPSISLASQTSSTAYSDLLVSLPNATLTYYIEILGPSTQVTLDVLATGGLTPTTGPLGVDTQLVVDVGTTVVGNVSISGDTLTYSGSGIQPGFSPSSFTMQTTIAAFTNSPIEVGISGAIYIEAENQGPVSASVYVDPYFSIDPSTPNADLYSIITSPGIGNALPSAVPEPSTWAMMLLGFAGLSFVGYRHSRKGRTARVASA